MNEGAGLEPADTFKRIRAQVTTIVVGERKSNIGKPEQLPDGMYIVGNKLLSGKVETVIGLYTMLAVLLTRILLSDRQSHHTE